MSNSRVKICGLNTPEAVAAASRAGASYLGFNFFPKSPRYVTPKVARDLAIEVPIGVAKVALSVDADDALLDEINQIVPIDMMQLHGNETPERVSEVKARYGLPVIKVLGISSSDDLDKIDVYSKVADMILVDAKAPKGAILPGGNGVPFDWRLIANRRWAVPWMLAGGLTPHNVAEAIALTGAQQVDTASGVEIAPGVKSGAMIEAFVKAAG